MSNLGSSLGAAIAGTILVAGITSTPSRAYALAMITLAVVGASGLVAAFLLPRNVGAATNSAPTPHDRSCVEGASPPAEMTSENNSVDAAGSGHRHHDCGPGYQREQVLSSPSDYIITTNNSRLLTVSDSRVCTRTNTITWATQT